MTNKEYKFDNDNGYACYAYGTIIDTNRNVLLTGKAGTGKSSLLKHIIESTKKKTVVLAATGAAAAIVEGITIHRFLSLPNSPLIIQSNRKIGKGISKKNREVIAELEMLIIDEISMVRVDMMDAIDYIFKLIRGNDIPFGGVQLVLVGDLYQLSPVMNKFDKQIILQNYSSEHFFNAHSIKAIELVKIELQKNYRQDDNIFCDILNKVRTGNITQEDLDVLNQRQNGNFCSDLGIILTTTNSAADRINQENFDSLEGYPQTFQAKIIGDWKGDLPTNNNLVFKVGAKVMITKNSTYGGNYFNGLVGYVKKFIAWDSTIVIRDESGDTLYIKPVKWKQYEYIINDGELKKKVIGEYMQYPLKLGYATTIHKSQGLNLFTVKLDLGNGVFGAGQLYVALSRVKSLKHLYLENKITLSDIKVDRYVSEFLKDVNDESILNEIFQELCHTESELTAVE